MTRTLRDSEAWVSSTIIQKLGGALKRRDGDPESLKADEILDTIGPSGELRLLGGTGKLLQVIEIDPTEDPCTVVLTDKKVKIACKISSDARRKHESSSKTKISTITGCIIKVLSYDIYFPGADGKLFWEGARDRSQIAVKPASQDRKAGKKEIQKNTMGDKFIKQDLGIGNKNADAELLPMPEPIFFITEFAILPGSCSDVRGDPKSVSSKPDLKPLLSGLPRKARSGREFSLSQYVPLPRKSSNEPSASSKVSADDESSDDEIRSQTDVHSGDVSSQDVSQLLFTTQDHLNTFDDLQFPKYKSQKKKPGANHPQNLIAIRGSLEPSAHDQGRKKTSKPHAHHARKNAEQTSLNTEPKFINYADRSDSEGPFVSSAVGWEGDSKDLSQTSNNRNKRKRGDLSTSFPSPDIGRRKGRKKSLGWGKMEQITPSQTIIPDDQLEILNRPESWYPYKNRHHVSGYDFVSKDQLVPKSHPPRKSNIQVIVPPVRSTVSSPEGTEISWPSSSIKSPLRGMNAVPPDSSFNSGTQSTLVGRLINKESSVDDRARSANGSSNKPSQVSVQGVGEEYVIPYTQQTGETYEKYEFKTKRVTRAANGISKKTPVDPNNVEPSRMANKQRFAAVRKQRPRREYRSEEDENYLSSGDDNINELINHPDLPVGVVDPNGRTRLEVFGGILKAQQVSLWERNGKQPQKRQDEDENENAQCNTDYDGDGGFDDEVWDNQLGSEDEENKVTGVHTEEVVGAIASKSLSPSPEAKQIEMQHHNEHISPAENATSDSLVVDHPMLSQHPTPDEPLPSSQRSGMLLSDGENDKIPESLPGSSIALPMTEYLGDHTDENEEEDEIPQAPLMPLKPALNCTERTLDNLDLQYSCSDILHTGPAETPKWNDASQVADGAGITMVLKSNKSDNLSRVLDPVAPEETNVSRTRKYDEGVAPALPSSPINSTAPSIQVEETPYKKGVGILGGDLSPTIAKSKSRIDAVCADEGLDITLIPGTNIEESHISQEPRSPVVQNSPTHRPVTIPERQMSSQDLPWPSVEAKDLRKGFSDDFVRSQEQLIREAQEHQKIEVPTTSEENQTRIKDEILSHSTAARQVSRFGPRKTRKLLKVVDFGTQEIREVANTRSVTDMLEKQKKEFMGYKEFSNITDMTERENSSMHGRPVVKPEVEAPDNNTLLNIDDQIPATPYQLSRSNDGEIASGIDQLNIRKRTHSSPSKKIIAAKKPRIDVSPYKDTCATTLPSSKKQRNFKVPASPQPESSSKPRVKVPGKGDLEEERKGKGFSDEEDFTMEDYMKEDSVKKDFEEKDLEESFELSNDDPMAGFPDITFSDEDDDDEPMAMAPEIIDLISDNEESELSEPSQPKSKPELYAGLRMRDIYVPGYERLTTDQKNDLDRRRKEYFGVKSSSERLFSAETQRAMTKANLEERESKKENKGSGESQRNEWYRDKDTPMKKFFRHFQELEKSKMKKAELNKPDEE